MLYAALGDSITYGYSSSSDAKRYVNRLQRRLATKNRIHVFMTAKPGWTSKQLLKAVRKVPDCIWEEAHIVTILIGGNDAMRVAPWLLNGNRARLMKVADELQENLSSIIEIVKRPHSILLVGTLYNPFPNSLVADECTEVLNRSIRKTARQHRVMVVDLERPFGGREAQLVDSYRHGTVKDFRLIRANPVHPNDTGHQVIAQAFLRTYRRVTQTRAIRRTKRTRNVKNAGNIASRKKDAT